MREERVVMREKLDRTTTSDSHRLPNTTSAPFRPPHAMTSTLDAGRAASCSMLILPGSAGAWPPIGEVGTEGGRLRRRSAMSWTSSSSG